MIERIARTGERRRQSGAARALSSAPRSCSRSATQGYLVKIIEGRIVVDHAGAVRHAELQLRAARAARRMGDVLDQSCRRPATTTSSRCSSAASLRIEGDLHPFMANLLYIKDVLAAPRREARAMSPRFEPIVGRYLNLELLGRPHRLYIEEAGQGIPLLCLHTAGSDGRQYRGLLNDPRITDTLPRHRLRHAVARQVLAAGRLAERGVPAHLARLRADDPARSPTRWSSTSRW